MTVKNELPIAVYRTAIVEAVRKNPVVIITAETGAGKSTQVPQYLADAGMRILCTQPRRLAASTLAERVAEERGGALGNEVGFRTARDRQDSEGTTILFCTDGLALIRELLAAQRNYSVLIVDEVHEWNVNVEILVAWARREIFGGADFKLVLMSATIEAEELSRYFGGAPIISIPGRCYPVEVQQACKLDSGLSKLTTYTEDMAADIDTLSSAGKNVLAFLPGKREIAQVGEHLAKLEANVVQLHGEQSRDEQRLAFVSGVRKVVLATNVAQTSITIEDIDAVVDSGLVRQIEVNHGVEGLFLRPCSKADAEQRKGRAGRTRPGVYIDHCPDKYRPLFQEAEIRRSLLDQVVLRLLVAGVDLEQLQLFHPCALTEVRGAKDTLVSIGCITPSGEITQMGARISRLPIGSRAGRALIEAERRGVVHQVIDALSVIEVAGIVDDRKVDENKQPIWRKHIADRTSDPLSFAQLLRQAERGRSMVNLLGLHGRKVHEALEVRKQLRSSLHRIIDAGRVDVGSRDDAAKCLVVAESCRLLRRTVNKWGEYEWGRRKLVKESGLDQACSAAKWAVGVPFDVSTKKGGVLHLLQQPTAVPADWIVELFPEQIDIRRSEPYYHADTDTCTVHVVSYIDGQLLSESNEPAAPEASSKCLATYILGSIEYGYYGSVLSLQCARQAFLRLKQVANRVGTPVDHDAIAARVTTLVGSAQSIAELPTNVEWVEGPSQQDLEEALKNHPDEIVVAGARYKVAYSTEEASIRIEAEDLLKDNLPESIHTPGGRSVKVEARVGWTVHESYTLSTLRDKALSVLQGEAAYAWELGQESEAKDELEERRYGPNDRWVGWVAAGQRFRNKEAAVKHLCTKVAYNLPWDHPARNLPPSEETLATLRTAIVIKDEEDVVAAQKRTAVRNVCGDDIEDAVADAIVAFVEGAIACRGEDTAIKVLVGIADADYGRNRRADALYRSFPNVQHYILDWKKGGDIELVVAYAKSVTGTKERMRTRPKKTAPASTGTFGSTLADLLRAKGQL